MHGFIRLNSCIFVFIVNLLVYFYIKSVASTFCKALGLFYVFVCLHVAVPYVPGFVCFYVHWLYKCVFLCVCLL